MEIKVKDLLEALKNADPEDNISIAMNSGCCGDMEYLDVNDINHSEYPFSKRGDKNYYSYIQITCDALPGYRSCRQVGGTKRDHKKYWMKKNGTHRPWAKITDVDLDQALAWADSQKPFATHRNEAWFEHFKRAIGMVNP